MTFPDETDGSQQDDGRKNRLLSSLKAARGVLLTLISAIFLGVSAQFMTLASKVGTPSLQILFLKRLTELVILLPLLAFSRPKLTGENTYQNIMILLMATVSNAAMVLTYVSFTYLVSGIAFGIVQGSMPFFAACIGLIFLKESLGLVNCCGILINVLGVVLVAVGIVQMGSISTQLLALSITIPLLGSLTFAASMVLIRYITGILGVSVITGLLYQDLVGAVALLAIMYAAETPVWKMSWRSILYVLGLGLSKSLSTFTIFQALKVEKAYITTAVRMLVIPFSIILDYFIMQKVPNALQWGGVALVLLGTILVATYTWWEHRKKTLHNIFLEKLQFGPNAAN